ncbi:hypothetical protein HRD49_23920 [Corallococcus exiguus]|uniref:hypothetical protein n=1 Tax=Corallococcus exiguus TaxID=83462 RepID=UPI0014716528|nr:hypothetical protein [Corallococcus exiguus]NNC17567.1 hypothetical protein [Corallococcus exiguus]NRD64804.1 hypothetical protein [Corallococcus exiguus]
MAWRTLFRHTGREYLGSFARTEKLIASFYVCAAAAVLLVTLRKRVSPGAVLVAIPFCAYHLSVYGSVFSPYCRHSLDPLAGLFFMALAANLVSP